MSNGRYHLQQAKVLAKIFVANVHKHVNEKIYSDSIEPLSAYK